MQYGDRQTDRQTNKLTNRWTDPLHEAALAVASGSLINGLSHNTPKDGLELALHECDNHNKTISEYRTSSYAGIHKKR